MVIEQAMAAGVPSVATRAGGVPWMLEDGVTGWTVPVPDTLAGDPSMLADALTRLLGDPAEAAAMGERAKAEAEERFRPSAVARRTYQVYQRVATA
jgi:starch synthase